MLFAGGQPVSSLGDYIDATDPCVVNPSDPICQAFGNEQDPCKVNPNASYCQRSIVQQAQSGQNTPYVPDYDFDTDSNAHTVLNPTKATTNKAASVAGASPAWWALGIIGAIAGGLFLFERYQERQGGKAVKAK